MIIYKPLNKSHADKGGKKWANICGRPLWIAPNQTILMLG